MSASATLRFFRDNTNLRSLPDSALKDLAFMSDGAEGEMRNITEVMRGMGCVISIDAKVEQQGETFSGSLRDRNGVSVMLFFLAEAMQAQIEALHIAANADFILKDRQQAKEARHG